jgi:hypothetical protein
MSEGIQNRPDDETDDSGDDLNAAEERARRRMGLPSLRKRLKLPKVSGKGSVLVLVLCFAASAFIVLPLAWKKPVWIEVEVVLAAWWVVWAVFLSILLHRGWHVSDDHMWTGPSGYWFSKSGDAEPSGCGWYFLDFGGFDLGASVGEGCAGVIAGVALTIAALVVLFFVAWFVIEVAIPAGAFVTYLLIRMMLARVANDHHGCENDWLKAGVWGLIWATIYTIPQVLVVWLVHILAMKSAVV